MNRAIEAAEGDYLIFSDGDCIPRADYVAAHKMHAQPGDSFQAATLSCPCN